ncbi:hypothetical protein D3C86_1482580 [compost metagenome]
MFVEGKDVKFLSEFYKILHPKSLDSFETIPHASTGGWSNWQHIVGTANAFNASTKGGIQVFAILDRDYRSGEEIEKVIKQTNTAGARLFVWNKKEIENYLLVPETILRLINSNKIKNVSINDVRDKLDEICERLKDDTFDAVAETELKADRPGGISAANKRAREIFRNRWKTLDDKLAFVSGKEVLKYLASWTQNDLGFSFSATSLLRFLLKDEISLDIATAIDTISKKH